MIGFVTAHPHERLRLQTKKTAYAFGRVSETKSDLTKLKFRGISCEFFGGLDSFKMTSRNVPEFPV